MAHGLSCSAACEIFLDHGSNPCFLCWRVDSLPLSHQGSPQLGFFITLALAPVSCQPRVLLFVPAGLGGCKDYRDKVGKSASTAPGMADATARVIIIILM